MKKLTVSQLELKSQLDKGRTFSQYNLGAFDNMLRWDDNKEVINSKTAIALGLTWEVKFNY